jgi:periplasmic divalent cation tolerance protein
MDAPVLVYTTYPSLVEAEKAGRLIVEAGLAACVNIVPEMVSIFRWKGQVERGAKRS